MTRITLIMLTLFCLAPNAAAQVLTLGPAAQGTEIATATVTPPAGSSVDVTINGVFQETLAAGAAAKNYPIAKGGTIQVTYTTGSGQNRVTHCKALKNNGYGNAPTEEECVAPPEE